MSIELYCQKYYGSDIPSPAYKISAGNVWTYEQISEKINIPSKYGIWGNDEVKKRLDEVFSESNKQI